MGTNEDGKKAAYMTIGHPFITLNEEQLSNYSTDLVEKFVKKEVSTKSSFCRVEKPETTFVATDFQNFANHQINSFLYELAKLLHKQVRRVDITN